MNGLIGENGSDETVIYQEGAVQIRVRNVADSAAIALLKRTVYGTNGVQYRRFTLHPSTLPDPDNQ